MLGLKIFLAITIVVFLSRMAILSIMKNQHEMHSTAGYFKDIFFSAGKRIKKISIKMKEQKLNRRKL